MIWDCSDFKLLKDLFIIIFHVFGSISPLTFKINGNYCYYCVYVP